jgi:hypothetical protein
MQTATITKATPIRLYDEPEGGDVLAVTTLGEFLADNADAFDHDERDLIATILEANGVYHGGGGAAAAWRVEVA